MTSRASFAGSVSETGRIKLDTPGAFRVALKPYHGKRVLLSLATPIKDKTLPQLGYFMGPVVGEWSAYTGYEHDEMYLELWRAWGPVRVVTCKLTGEPQIEKPRISDYTAEEMSQLISRSVKEGNLMGLTFPDPATWQG